MAFGGVSRARALSFLLLHGDGVVERDVRCGSTKRMLQGPYRSWLRL